MLPFLVPVLFTFYIQSVLKKIKKLGCQKVKMQVSRSQWPSGLSPGYFAIRLLGLWVRIPPGSWKFISCEFCVLSGTGHCVRPITRPEESYRVWCAWVWLWILDNEEALAHWRMLRHGKIMQDTKIFMFHVRDFACDILMCLCRSITFSNNMSTVKAHVRNYEMVYSFSYNYLSEIMIITACIAFENIFFHTKHVLKCIRHAKVRVTLIIFHDFATSIKKAWRFSR
jgi:hypothetical protein